MCVCVQFKLQGATLDYLVLSVSPREFAPPFSLNGLYVLASRVRTSGGLFILEAVKDWKHLLALQHPLELEIWEGSYPNKVFDAKAAAEAAERVSKRIEEQKNEAEQRKKAEKSAKAKAQRRSGTSAGVSMAGVKRSTKQTTVGDTSKVSTSKAKATKPEMGVAVASANRSPTCPAWAISTRWHNNSCAYDAVAKALHVGYRAASEWRGNSDRYQAPPRLPRRQPRQGGVAPADMGAAMRRWMEVQEAMANCTLPQRGAQSEQLTQARNELRNAYLRTKLFKANQATRNASVATEEQIVSRVHAQRGAHQAAAEVLRELARFEEGTPLVSGPPDFLGGRCGVAQCNDCGCERPTLLSDDCRVHDVLQSELRATMGDPIKALQSKLFDESQVRGVGNCSCGSRSWRPKSWYIASCAAADGPPLVALEVGGLQVDAVRLDAVRRDASVMVTPFGNVTYALVALVYSNGGHFITVGRSASGCRNGLGAAESSWYVLGASTWWCWDGLRSGGWGEGQPLDSPPLHGTQELRSGSHRWVNYQPHLFIYCRTQ